jgi:hypothetical protein
MTVNQTNESSAPITAVVAPSFGERLGAWSEDPFALLIGGTVAISAAVGFVLSGMWIINMSLA